MRKLSSHSAHKWVRITVRGLFSGRMQRKQTVASAERLSWQQSAPVVWYCTLEWRVLFWTHSGSCMTTTLKYRSAGSKTATFLAVADGRSFFFARVLLWLLAGANSPIYDNSPRSVKWPLLKGHFTDSLSLLVLLSLRKQFLPNPRKRWCQLC